MINKYFSLSFKNFLLDTYQFFEIDLYIQINRILTYINRINNVSYNIIKKYKLIKNKLKLIFD